MLSAASGISSFIPQFYFGIVFANCINVSVKLEPVVLFLFLKIISFVYLFLLRIVACDVVF